MDTAPAGRVEDVSDEPPLLVGESDPEARGARIAAGCASFDGTEARFVRNNSATGPETCKDLDAGQPWWRYLPIVASLLVVGLTTE